MPHHPQKKKTLEWFVIIVIILTAFVFRFKDIVSIPPGLYPDEAMNGNNALHAIQTGDYRVFYPDNNGREGLFMNIQAQSIRIFGNTPWALRVVSAFFGLGTVIGLYFLTRRLFNWEIAALASFMMAISFWHVLFSRIGFRAIMAPFFLVWALFFFWRGKMHGHIWDFVWSGALWGLGLYSYIAFRVMPLALILTLIAYWFAVKKDFGHEKYRHVRMMLERGFAALLVAAILVALPLGYYFWTHPADFLGRTSQLSVFASAHPIQDLATNTMRTLGMFNFTGDWNWRHNLAGEAQLFWPIGLFFLIGFIRSWYKLFKTRRTHGHFPTVQISLLSWFFLALVPVIISNEGLPHALRALLVIPVVFIFAGEGLWWIYDFCKKWYGVRDMHEVEVHGWHAPEGKIVATCAIAILLFALTISEYNKYFVRWANNPNTAAAYAQQYADIAGYINTLPISVKKYVYVNADGVPVVPPGGQPGAPDGISMPAQTVMYLTDTWTYDKQQAKNIYYVTRGEYSRNPTKYNREKYFIPLEPISN